MRCLIPLFTAVLCLVSPVGAQEDASLAPGSRVRVKVPSLEHDLFGGFRSQRLAGEVLATRGDTLLLEVHPDLGPLAIPLSSLQRLEVSHGFPTRAESAFRGALRMAPFAAVEWTLLNRIDGDPLHDSDGKALLVGAAIGAVGGAIFGAIFPEERWRRMDLPPETRDRS